MGFDVIVCGGGPAGLAAAAAAAREGCSTALVERYGFLGGTASGGLVIPISGFFHNGTRVVGGIAWELVQRLKELGAARVEYPKGHVSVHPEYWKLAAQRLALESGVTLYTNTVFTEAVMDGRRVRAIRVSGRSGSETLEGGCFVDATGDAELCRSAGVPMLPAGRELQPLSLCFLLEGVDVSTPLLRDSIRHDGKNGSHSCNLTIQRYLQRCVDEGKLRQFGGPWFNTVVRGSALAVNVTRAAADAGDRAALTAAELQLREDMFIIVELLREEYPEFRNCQIVTSGVNAGVRETRRIRGLETVTVEDLLSGRRPACPVARCAHPMDIHKAGDARQDLKALDVPGYIPHGALIPVGTDNLLAAGRCISADQDAFASLRVQATVMGIGEAAGILAASGAKSGVPVPELDAGTVLRRFRTRHFLEEKTG